MKKTLSNEKLSFCESCVKAQITHRPLNEIKSKVCGPMSVVQCKLRKPILSLLQDEEEIGDIAKVPAWNEDQSR